MATTNVHRLYTRHGFNNRTSRHQRRTQSRDWRGLCSQVLVHSQRKETPRGHKTWNVLKQRKALKGPRTKAGVHRPQGNQDAGKVGPSRGRSGEPAAVIPTQEFTDVRKVTEMAHSRLGCHITCKNI